jgi:hypothetical protein
MTKDDEELKVIYSALDDCRRLIAAGKVQRWDVVKWGVTVNVALAQPQRVSRGPRCATGGNPGVNLALDSP